MATLPKRTRNHTQTQSTISIPYIDTFKHVRHGYGTSTWSWIVMILVATSIGLYYFTSKGLSTFTVLVLSTALYVGLFAPLYFLRASDAMLLGQISERHIERCIRFLKQQSYNQKQLKKIKQMAEADKASIPNNTTLTNVFWPLVLTLGAMAYQFKDVPIPVWVFIAAFVFVTVPVLSFLVQTERGNADLVIIQAVTQIEED